ncbi:ATP-binding cassette domain-containing protein [Thermomonospora amylolytica]|uniref:ATP-binding cassette domain-containing protein n=1 Tax=Thermomonospora amylolytica TaxID=1411117 RepID=UPI000E6C23D0|nr:excinuclease ABC subunit UvrA [Thermomonospora amylolytica]
MTADSILVTGARENNLKDVTLAIPKNRIVVFTGVSGSGKSSIVFDTVAVESQRQLNETFSWFVRSRLPKYDKPEADSIDNLSPAIVVDQKPIGGNSRSTVGTMTDIYSVIRVLFSRCGVPEAGTSSVFSFNDPQGMCPECDGLGRIVRLDLDRFLDRSRSLNEGPFRFPQTGVGSIYWQMYAGSGRFDLDKPLADYTAEEWEFLLHGTGKTALTSEAGTYTLNYEGVVDRFTRLYLRRDISALADKTRDAVLSVVSEVTCPACDGARLNERALASRINGHTIADYSRMEITDLVETLAAIDDPVGAPIAAAAIERLRRVISIGLGYLTLGRETSTLSGGEGQRLKMVRHLGSALTGMTYIFDEPSVGLHPRDVHRLNELLVQLRDKGNTVLVVEHDPDVIAVADHVIDIGPGAGAHGGEVVFQGEVAALRQADTPTGRGLRNVVPIKTEVRAPTGELRIENASLHNLRNVSVGVPTGVLTAVTGVAGSGKSTLISEVLVAEHPEAIVVDQSAIGVSSRSSPASYVGVLDHIRRLFAQENGGRKAGVDAGMFSYNSAGACPSCEGRGVIYTDLAFMDPITTTCEVCEGRRFSDEVLKYTVRGKSIADVLEMTAEQALDFFPEKRIRTRLRTLNEVGLDYLTLGQPLSTLSGGERQRIKLANELHKTGSVYVLDEPTTGLHMADIGRLVVLLDRLVDGGNTVVVIEHNLDVVKRADWIIDLGPDGGKHGGQVIFEGTPAALLDHPTSLTAEHVRRSLS